MIKNYIASSINIQINKQINAKYAYMKKIFIELSAHINNVNNICAKNALMF